MGLRQATGTLGKNLIVATFPTKPMCAKRFVLVEAALNSSCWSTLAPVLMTWIHMHLWRCRSSCLVSWNCPPRQAWEACGHTSVHGYSGIFGYVDTYQHLPYESMVIDGYSWSSMDVDEYTSTSKNLRKYSGTPMAIS